MVQREAASKIAIMTSIVEGEDEQQFQPPVLLQDLVLSRAEHELPVVVKVHESCSCDIVSLVRATVKKNSLSNRFSSILHPSEASRDRASLISTTSEKPVLHLTASTLTEHRTFAAGLRVAMLSLSVDDNDLDLKLFSPLPPTAAAKEQPSAWTLYQSVSGDALPFQEYFLYELVMNQSPTGTTANGSPATGSYSNGTRDATASSPGVGCCYDEDHIYQDLFGLLCSPLSSMAIGSCLQGLRYRRRFIVPHETKLASGAVLRSGSELVVAASDMALSDMTNRNSREDLSDVGSDETYVPCWLLERPNPLLASYDSRRRASFISIPLHASITCMPSDSCHCAMLQYDQVTQFMQGQDVSTVAMQAFAYPLLEPCAEMKQVFPSDLATCQISEVVERVVVQRRMSVLCSTESELLRLAVSSNIKLAVINKTSEDLYRCACRFLAKLTSPSTALSSVRNGSMSDVSAWKPKTEYPACKEGAYAQPIDAWVSNSTEQNAAELLSCCSPLPTKSSPGSPTTIPKVRNNVKCTPNSPAARTFSMDVSSDAPNSEPGRRASLDSCTSQLQSSTQGRPQSGDTSSFDMLSDLCDSGTFDRVAISKITASVKRNPRAYDSGLRASFRNPSRFVPFIGNRSRPSNTTTSSTWFRPSDSTTTRKTDEDGDTSTGPNGLEELTPDKSNDVPTCTAASLEPCRSQQLVEHKAEGSAGQLETCRTPHCSLDTEDDVNTVAAIPRSSTFSGLSQYTLSTKAFKKPGKKPVVVPPKPPTARAEDSSSVHSLESKNTPPVPNNGADDAQEMGKEQAVALPRTPQSYHGKPPPPQPIRRRKDGAAQAPSQSRSRENRYSRIVDDMVAVAHGAQPVDVPAALESGGPGDNAVKTGSTSVRVSAYSVCDLLAGPLAAATPDTTTTIASSSSAASVKADAQVTSSGAAASTGDVPYNAVQVSTASVQRVDNNNDDREGNYALLGRQRSQPVSSRTLPRTKPAPAVRKRSLKHAAPRPPMTPGTLSRNNSDSSTCEAQLSTGPTDSSAPHPISSVDPATSASVPESKLSVRAGTHRKSPARQHSPVNSPARRHSPLSRNNSNASECLHDLLANVKPPGTTPPKRASRNPVVSMTFFDNIVPHAQDA